MNLKINGIVTVIIFATGSALFAQDDTVAVNSVLKFQRELNAEFKDAKTSPLEAKALRKFKGLPYFDIALKYRVEATLTITDNEPYFKMMTSDNRSRNYRQYGTITFNLEGNEFTLPVYQSQQLISTAEYADYLFFPFTDLTNGHDSYSAGRYIDLRIPKEGTIVIVDFNKAYNPLCAYSDRYSCPIVPEKNHLPLEIKAGVQYSGKH